MSSVRYTKEELHRIVAARHGQPEGAGQPSPMMEFRIQVSPELLEDILGCTLIRRDGRHVILDGVWVGEDGYAEPWFREEQPA